MSKKIITFSLIAALFMFVEINVKAYTNCANYQKTKNTCSGACQGTASEGTTACSSRGSDSCSGDGCSWNSCASGSSAANDGCENEPAYCESSSDVCSCKSATARSLTGCGGKYSKDGSNGGNSCIVSLSGKTEDETIQCKATSSLGTVTPGGVVTITGSPTGASCTGTITVSCVTINGCGNSSSAKSTTVKVMTPWSTKGTKVDPMNPNLEYLDRPTAEESQSSVYYKQEGGEWKKYTRGTPCGNQPEIPEQHCYEDTNTGFLYWDYDFEKKPYKYQEYVKGPDGGMIWQAKSPYKYRGDITSAKKCKTQFGCTLPVYPKDKNVETTCNSIEDISSSDQDYHKHCGVKGGDEVNDKIYSITCRETMKTAFNGPVWDNNHSFMYPGTGFGFNYQVKTKVACDGTWNKSFYEKALKYTEDYLDAHKEYEGKGVAQDGVNDVANQYWYASAKSGMEDIKKSYINWSLKSIYFSTSKTPANGTIGDDQSELNRSNGRVKDEYKENLELEKEYNSTQPTAECYSKTSSGATTQSVPDNFKYQVAYTFNFRLPLLYYTDKGTYTTEDCATCGKLGRIFPISENEEYAGNTKYVYKVDINNLGMNHNWENYEVCSIGDGMKKKEIVFRQVNLSDPFIQKLSNSNHEIGRNWKNDKYDFTNVIDANIWNKDSQYNTVTINQDIGKAIKAELSNQANSYIGSCSKQTSNGATPTICGLYNQARKK